MYSKKQEEWKKRLQIQKAREVFLLETEPMWHNLKEIPEDIAFANNVEVTGDAPSRDIEPTAKSVEWKLHIGTFEQVKLLKVGFHRASRFKVRTEDQKDFVNMIDIPEKQAPNHNFEILLEPEDVHRSITGDLICEFTGPILYRLRFRVKVKRDGIDIPFHMPLIDENWAGSRTIIRYDNTEFRKMHIDEVVRDIENQYTWRPMRNEIDLQNVSTENYADKMHDLLHAEEKSRQDVLARLNIDCKIEYEKSLGHGHMLWKFYIPLSLSTDEALLLKSSCRMVLIGKIDDNYAYQCKIRNIDVEGVTDSKNTVKIMIDVPPGCCKDLKLRPNSSSKTRVQFQLDRQLFCLRHFAIDNVDDKIKLICPSKENLAALKPISEDLMCENLDTVQDKVLQYVSVEKLENEKSKIYPPVVVAGSFGCGKTWTMQKILSSLLDRRAHKPILLCTHTDSAADLYLYDKNISVTGQGKILRVNYHGRNLRSGDKNIRKFCLFDEMEQLRYPTIEELMQCKLVITTFTTALSLFLEIGSTSGIFGHIFLDEASQAMEADVIMPLLLADCKTTRIVLAGDHKQNVEKMYFCQCKSIIERLYANAKGNGIKTVLLCNNYRCVKGILDLLSKIFYKTNALENRAHAECIPGKEAVYFRDVQGDCVNTPNGDYINDLEAYYIRSELEWLIKEKKTLQVTDVVVISAFPSQVKHVRKILQLHDLGEVSVQNVYAIQGKEFKVVYLTTVMRHEICKKTPGQNFGFLSDKGLLNVAMTRAKSMLVVVGDATTLCANGECMQDWKTYLQFCYRNHTFSQVCPSQLEPNQTQDDHSNSPSSSDTDDSLCHEGGSDDIETDSGCSETSVDDIILGDMVKYVKATKRSKITAAIDRRQREYDSSNEEEEDNDPNEILQRHAVSRRPQNRKARYPTYTIEELEQKLRHDRNRFKRCTLNVKSWFCGEAIPIADDGEENEMKEEVNESLDGNNNEEESDGVRYELNLGMNEANQLRIPRYSTVIYIETRLHLGRTFDKDEVLVEIIDYKREPENPDVNKRIGKVLGVLRDRPINPINQHILCRPNDMSPIVMNPYDQKLPLFGILAPATHEPKLGIIPIYKWGHKEKNSARPLHFQEFVHVDDRRVYVVRYLKWSESSTFPLGFVENSFEFSEFRKYLCLEYRVCSAFRQQTVNEVAGIEEPQFDRLPYIEVFTIDPKGCKDIDDAISFTKCDVHSHCYLIGIHITDVASVVREGSAVDLEARRRRATFYGLEEPVHMLPTKLSTERCSIVPGKIRQAVSTVLHSSIPLYANGKTHPDFEAVRPERTYIKSVRKMTYAQAEKLYKACELNRLDKICETDAEYAKTIHKLWGIMWQWRLARLGAEAFYKQRNTFDHILEAHAHLLIEEAMIATNMNTARYLIDWGVTIPVRAQRMPEERDWTTWEKIHANLIPNSCYLNSLKKHLRRRQDVFDGRNEESDSSEDEDSGEWENVVSTKKPTSQIPKAPEDSIQKVDYITILDTYWSEMLKASDEESLDIFAFLAACDDLHPSQIPSVNSFVRSQKEAYFTTRSEYHFSLRLDSYTWSTSPIRRYADILIQRCIVNLSENQSINENTKEVIKRFCRDTDNRHNEFERKFVEASLAESFEKEPVVFEACIEQVSEAFIQISIPLAKFVAPQSMQIKLGNLMIQKCGNGTGDNTSSIESTSTTLEWTLRYYKYGDQNDSKSCMDPVSVVKIPARLWKNFVQVLSRRPTLLEHELDQYQLDLREAVRSLTDAAERPKVKEGDEMVAETPTAPDPIKHKRRICWKYGIGSSVLVQLTGSQNTSQLPTPDVQLFSIASDLDICVEHMKEPLKIFAKDVKKISSNEILNLRQYRNKWEPLVRMDGADTPVRENSSITIEGVALSKEGHTKPKRGVSEPDKPSFQLLLGFCYNRYIAIKSGDFICCRLKGVPSQGRKGDSQYRKFSTKGIRNRYTAVVHGLVTDTKESNAQPTCMSALKTMREPTARLNQAYHNTTLPKKQRKGSGGKLLFVYFQVLSGAIPPGTENGRLWTVEVMPLSYVHRCMQRALRTIASPSFDDALIQAICLGTIRQVPVPWHPETKKRWLEKRLEGFPFVMNKLQQEQEQIAIQSNFSLIQGPPGTGKSLLGAHIAAKFAHMNKAGGTKDKVLYVGPSNKSVDVAARYLLESSKKGGLKVVRMYSLALEEKLYPNPLKPSKGSAETEDDSKKPDPQLSGVALHELIRAKGNEFSEEIKKYDDRVKRVILGRKNQKLRDSETQKQEETELLGRKYMDEYYAVVKAAKVKELQDADIVICTCSCSYQLTNMMRPTEDNSTRQDTVTDKHTKLRFAQCIIDECGMCSEPEAILPLVAVRPRQVVLIGDHMQLRPVITCSKAEKLGLSESLFMRYKDKVGMLTTQYRMHEHIMRFPSRQFYKNQLVCDETVRSRRGIPHDPFGSYPHRVIFWNVKGTEGVQHFKTVDYGDQSKFNITQAKAVVQLLQRLHSCNIPLDSIMVLSPYTAQGKIVRDMLQSKGDLANVHVGTVVTSQGSEADIVILSTVRALPSSSIMLKPNLQWSRKHLGFLSDPNQVNVALTRAKERLFIIGDKELLQVDTLWRELLTEYVREGAITDDLLRIRT